LTEVSDSYSQFALSPAEATAQLELRVRRLEAELADTDRALAEVPPGLPRLFVLEEDYRKEVLTAELRWLDGVIEDLRQGRLTWSEQWLREMAAAFIPADDDDNR